MAFISNNFSVVETIPTACKCTDRVACFLEKYKTFLRLRGIYLGDEDQIKVLELRVISNNYQIQNVNPPINTLNQLAESTICYEFIKAFQDTHPNCNQINSEVLKQIVHMYDNIV